MGIGLIHGDAWAGNLLWDNRNDSAQPILADWDLVSIGQREIDLIPTWHAAVRYGRDQTWVRNFIEEYGYDLSEWSGYRVLLDMRDLVQVSGPLRRAVVSAEHADRLRQRVDDIRAGNRNTSWSQYIPHDQQPADERRDSLHGELIRVLDLRPQPRSGMMLGTIAEGADANTGLEIGSSSQGQLGGPTSAGSMTDFTVDVASLAGFKLDLQDLGTNFTANTSRLLPGVALPAGSAGVIATLAPAFERLSERDTLGAPD
ncbi:phosphotransferase family protein [Nocardia sp. NBC_00403]|uniref:phosphotransferase family protein n=1 Tax=Nocardia sp. NBC_00403 TaxID=2975990 RepID=UPI002E1D5B17